MNEQEALARMVPPGQVRPGKMGGGGIVQILLTRACTLSCFGCTQGSNLAGKTDFMSLDHFEKAVLSLRGYFGLVALFGGQPTLHPQFREVCEILSKHVPIEKRGLWTNALNGHGSTCRKTFLPHNCNLNVHLSKPAWDEFKRDWPESMPFGLTQDSRHPPPFVAMKDVINDEGKRWELISGCDINRSWSALIGTFRGELRAWFCEVAGAQAMLHQHEPDYPDTGLDPTQGFAVYGGWYPWWMLKMEHFAHQVRKHCHDCGVPLRGYGELAQAADGTEQTSQTHAAVYRPKRRGRAVQVVDRLEQLGVGRLQSVTRYLQNAGV